MQLISGDIYANQVIILVQIILSWDLSQLSHHAVTYLLAAGKTVHLRQTDFISYGLSR